MYVKMSPAMFIPMLAICAALAYATGRIARNKGYSYRAFAALGFILPVIGLVIAAVMPYKEPQSRTDEISNAKAIAEYKKLLDAGTITQEEFDAKKRELL